MDKKLQSCLDSVRKRTDFIPEIAIVLGSGLGELAEHVDPVAEIFYQEIENFPVSTAPGHKGRFVFGELGGKKVVMMQGRVHLYEGYPASDVVLPIRLMYLLGARTLLLTNAAGAVNEKYEMGDFCVLKDHIAALVDSPLRGKNLDELGPRFPDMTKVYDEEISKLIVEIGRKKGATMHRGVYMQFPGPAYETPAEIHMARVLGADMVGMSTAIEAMAARHMGMRIAGVSLCTNKAAGMNEEPLSEEEVILAGQRASKVFLEIVEETIKNLI